jgi:hypothetical protein
MSPAYVAARLEMHVNQSPSDGQDLAAAEHCNDKPPPTEAYRNLQFLDVADELEGPPPFRHDIGDTFIILHDIHYQIPSQSTMGLAISDRIMRSEADQRAGTSDFILFRDELLWTDGFDDASSSDVFSSQASCCSEISVDSSTESSTPSSPPALTEHPVLARVKSSHSDFKKSRDMHTPVDTDRLLGWLQNLLSPPKEIAPSVGIQSDQPIFQRLDMPRDDPDSHDDEP